MGEHEFGEVTHDRFCLNVCYSIMPLEATTMILLPSNLSSISATPQIQLRSLNDIIKVNKITP